MIAISNNHMPMHIEKDTIDKIIDFVDFFPHYMIGSNAALPIIGGSILNHEHFQGGGHVMPMHRAPIKKKFMVKDFPQVSVGIVDWYNSVIRLESSDKDAIKKVATRIIDKWANHTDEECDIISSTNGVRHNSLSPVARKTEKGYIIDIILRNNRTSKEYPEGIFHAHPEYHNVKKEGIGLIEAMGLFILPGRLKKQFNMIADILCGNTEYDQNQLCDKDNYLHIHKDMILGLIADGKCKDFDSANKKIIDYVNDVCKNILYNTAVYKNDNNGQAGFIRFLNNCNIV
jgi:UDPglucose--hexose-1-phosphate uridylyltransferase